MRSFRTLILLLACLNLSVVDNSNLCFSQVRAVDVRSAEGIDAVYRHRMRGIEQQAKLNELDADTLTNLAGLTIPTKSDADEKRISDIAAGCVDYVPWITLGKVKTGEVGRLRYPSNASATTHHAIVKILQVTGKGELIGKVFGETYWIKGIDTSNLVDGKEFILSTPVEATGTETYQTAVGTNTVMKLEVTEQSKLVAKIRDRFKSQPPDENGDYFRLWTARNGVGLIAKLTGKEKQNCTFEKPDGTTIEVKTSKLNGKAKKVISKIMKQKKAVEAKD